MIDHGKIRTHVKMRVPRHTELFQHRARLKRAGHFRSKYGKPCRKANPQIPARRVQDQELRKGDPK